MKKKPSSPFLITLDFDGTLFDSPSRIAGIKELKKIAGDRFLAILEEYRTREEFLPESFCEFLYAKGFFSRAEKDRALAQFLELQEHSSRYLYKDSLAFLSKFPKELLVVLSRAHPLWQEKTIRNSGICDKVRDILIVQGTLGKRNALRTLVPHATRIIHIDDDTGEIAQIQGIHGVLPMFIRRRHRTEPYGCESLSEAYELIKSLLASSKKMR